MNTSPFSQTFPQSFTSTMPAQPLAPWLTPTANVQELERRIQELKTVQFWLEQNTRALAAGIQMLEVQKLTLITLNNMGTNMAEIMRIWPNFGANTVQNNNQDNSKNLDTLSSKENFGENSNHINAFENMMQPWWGALFQQFQNIATQVAPNNPSPTKTNE